MDIKIFIQCDSDIALGRRLIRDMKERGRDAIEVLTRYNRFVRDDFNNYVKPYMKYADLIIPGGADNRSSFGSPQSASSSSSRTSRTTSKR